MNAKHTLHSKIMSVTFAIMAIYLISLITGATIFNIEPSEVLMSCGLAALVFLWGNLKASDMGGYAVARDINILAGKHIVEVSDTRGVFDGEWVRTTAWCGFLCIAFWILLLFISEGYSIEMHFAVDALVATFIGRVGSWYVWATAGKNYYACMDEEELRIRLKQNRFPENRLEELVTRARSDGLIHPNTRTETSDEVIRA